MLVSGVTVIVAMAGMMFAGDSTFTALGIGAMLVVAVAMIGSVTVIPALLSGSGKWLERGRIPFLGKRMAAARTRDIDSGGARGTPCSTPCCAARGSPRCPPRPSCW